MGLVDPWEFVVGHLGGRYLTAHNIDDTLAVIVVRRGRKTMRTQGATRADFWRTRRKPFVIVTVLEVAGCSVAVILANLFHRPDWLAVGISLVVGLHFLPLGRIFEVVVYYWVGSLIVLWDILTIAASKSWNLTASASIPTGLILWATSIYVLVRSFRTILP